MKVNFNTINISEEEIIRIRKSLYHSKSEGFFVFRDFISPEMVNHIIDFWTNENFDNGAFMPFNWDKTNSYYFGCPNYKSQSNYGHAFHNFFWNHPVDEATHSVAFSVQILRNLITSNVNYNEFFAFSGYSTSYRIICTLNGENIVAPHTDFMGENFNPARLQATLILTKKDVDYSGKGMWFISNDKKTEYIFDGNLEVKPGDLVLWRYNNLHAVQDIKSNPGQRGFMRIVFPAESIYEKRTPTKAILQELKKRVIKKIKKSLNTSTN